MWPKPMSISVPQKAVWSWSTIYVIAAYLIGIKDNHIHDIVTCQWAGVFSKHVNFTSIIIFFLNTCMCQIYTQGKMAGSRSWQKPILGRFYRIWGRKISLSWQVQCAVKVVPLLKLWSSYIKINSVRCLKICEKCNLRWSEPTCQCHELQ